eukprot:2802979-Pyramimonas_sp.AAC.1
MCFSVILRACVRRDDGDHGRAEPALETIPRRGRRPEPVQAEPGGDGGRRFAGADLPKEPAARKSLVTNIR